MQFAPVMVWQQCNECTEPVLVDKHGDAVRYGRIYCSRHSVLKELK